MKAAAILASDSVLIDEGAGLALLWFHCAKMALRIPNMAISWLSATAVRRCTKHALSAG
jgi:hypothetical protein